MRLSVGIVAAALMIPCGPAGGQEAEQTKLLCRRSAEADAYRKLAETIKGLEINSETYVRDFVTESDVIESELDKFIKGVRLGQVRYYDDGLCEVDAEVTVAKVIEELKQLKTRHYQGGRVVGTDFDQMEQRIEKKIIQVTGSGAPRPDLPPDLPDGVDEVITPAEPAPRTASYPGIWRAVPPQAKLMAVQAARRDAQRKLLERILGVRIKSDTYVRDFVTESDEIRAQANGLVVGSEETKRYFHHDELIVEVTMAVPTEQVVRSIRELHTRYYKGDRVTGTDLEHVKTQIKRRTFEATGSGVPPKKYMARANGNGQTGAMVPDWANTRITATGHGTDPQIDSPQGSLRAIRAATMDARRNLIERLYGLQLTSQTLVKDYVTVRDEIRAQVQALIAGSVIEDRKVENGQATVVVSLGGPDVWRTLHSQIAIEKRHGQVEGTQ